MNNRKKVDPDTLDKESPSGYLVDDSFRDSYKIDYAEQSTDAMTPKTSVSHAIATAEMGEELYGFRSDRRVRLLRDTALMLLLLTGMFVSSAIYLSLKSSEQREFENIFYDQASQVGRDLSSQLEVKLRALDAFSVSITSYGRQVSSGWPYITVPDFAERASSTLRASKGIALAIHPVVKGEDLTEWEKYAVQNQAWLEESLDFQSRQAPGSSTTAAPNMISEVVYRVVDGTPTEVQGPNTRLPLWEHFPAHDGLPPVNYDASSNRLHKDALDVVIDNGVPVLGQAFEMSRSFHG